MSLFFLFPVIWMIANSFKPDAAITKDMNSIAAFIPPALNGSFFDNYVSILTNTSFIHYMLNTLFYAAILIILVLSPKERTLSNFFFLISTLYKI